MVRDTENPLRDSEFPVVPHELTFHWGRHFARASQNIRAGGASASISLKCIEGSWARKLTAVILTVPSNRDFLHSGYVSSPGLGPGTQ